jgi:integrase
MNKYIYKSVLKDELNNFLKLRESQGFKDSHRFILASLDKYLVSQNVSQKLLGAEVVDSWLTYACGRQSTNSMNNYIGYYSSFAKYLRIIGIDVFIPEFVRVHKSYAPYIFTELEMERIFTVADNIRLRNYAIPQAQFSVLLRILYGCGLRLGEALALKKGDVDRVTGVLLIRNAKGNRDRLVPVDPTLTETLSQYCDCFLRDKSDDTWLFESDAIRKIRVCTGKPRTPKWAHSRFRAVLAKAGLICRNYRESNEISACIVYGTRLSCVRSANKILPGSTAMTLRHLFLFTSVISISPGLSVTCI